MKRATKLSFVLLRAKRSEAKRAKSRAREEENEFKNEPLFPSQFSSKKTKKTKSKAASRPVRPSHSETTSRTERRGRGTRAGTGSSWEVRERERGGGAAPPLFFEFSRFFPPSVSTPLSLTPSPLLSLSFHTPPKQHQRPPPSRGRRRPRARVARARPRPGRHHPLRVRRRSARLRRPPHDGAEAGRIRRARVHRAGRQSG